MKPFEVSRVVHLVIASLAIAREFLARHPCLVLRLLLVVAGPLGRDDVELPFQRIDSLRVACEHLEETVDVNDDSVVEAILVVRVDSIVLVLAQNLLPDLGSLLRLGFLVLLED